MTKGSGIAWPSFTATLIEECSTNGRLSKEDEDSIKGAAANLYGGMLFTGLIILLLTQSNRWNGNGG